LPDGGLADVVLAGRAVGVAKSRQPVAIDNPYLALQTQISGQIIAGLDAYRAARDKLAEQAFFGFYGAPFMQALLGFNKTSELRPIPATSPETRVARQVQSDAYAAMLLTGGFDEAVTRAVLYVTAADRMLDQRCALALNAARQHLMRLSLAAFKVLVRDQFFVLQLEHEQAVDALATLVLKTDARKKLLQHVQMIVGAGNPPSAGERERLTRLSQVLAVPMEKPAAATMSRRSSAKQANARPDAVLH
jgi:hypothetical protein